MTGLVGGGHPPPGEPHTPPSPPRPADTRRHVKMCIPETYSTALRSHSILSLCPVTELGGGYALGQYLTTSVPVCTDIAPNHAQYCSNTEQDALRNTLRMSLHQSAQKM